MTNDDSNCWEWPGFRTRAGYPKVRGDLYAHRLVFFGVHGYYPPVVMHTCDNPPCVNPAHLVGGTQADNLADMFAKGRARRAQGESVATAKLTRQEVVIIRAELRAGTTPAELARQYRVSHKTIRQIRDHKTWSDTKEST